MKYLLDTNVVSEALRARPDARVAEWFQSTSDELQFLSVITIAEVRRGMMSLPAGAKRDSIGTWLSDGLLKPFSGRILEIDVAVSEKWGDLMALRPPSGRNFPAMDTFIAATAIIHACVIVTRNTKDFEGMGIETLNPWAWQNPSGA